MDGHSLQSTVGKKVNNEPSHSPARSKEESARRRFPHPPVLLREWALLNDSASRIPTHQVFLQQQVLRCFEKRAPKSAVAGSGLVARRVQHQLTTGYRVSLSSDPVPA